MANMITEKCCNCGACESICPGQGISMGEKVFVIDPARCTECVGFFRTQQCARVCPIDCCVTDPNNVETEAVLFERAKKLFPNRADTLELGPKTSHFQAARNRTQGSTFRRLGRRLSEALRSPSLPA